MPIKAIVFDAYGTLYDVASIVAAIDAVFPGRAEIVTTIWRMKQLEYSWLRTIMGRWEELRSVTRDSLSYTLDTLGLVADAPMLNRLVAAQDQLLPYLDAEQALAALSGYRMAILSNGSQPMLDALVGNSGLGQYLEAVISVDPAQAFKPDPRAYALVQQRLGVTPAEVAFVTGNGFDTAGAGSFGFKVVRVERVTPDAIRQELAATTPGPAAMFRALRMRLEGIGFEPARVVRSLTALPDAVRTL